MSFKASNFKRILAILVTLAMCFGTTLTAFAAEEVPAADVDVVDEESLASTYAEPLVSAVSPQFTDTRTLNLSLSNGNWSADFKVGIDVNPGVSYWVSVTTPDNQQFSATILADGYMHSIQTLSYAPAGVYKFYFVRQGGSAASVRAYAAIYD